MSEARLRLVMECDGLDFAVSHEVVWLLARCASPAIEVRAPDFITLRRRVSEAVANRVPELPRHVLHARGTR